MRCVCLAVFMVAVQASAAEWVTLKGQVVWPKDKAIPAVAAVVVNVDKEHCNSKGALMSDDLIINPKNRGIKNVFVYLRPASKESDAKLTDKDIHPDLLKPKPVVHEADQPCCLFVPKFMALRSGDFIKFKNSSPVLHNVNLSADAPSPTFNKGIASGGFFQDPAPFVAQNTPINYSCSIHPWMKGKIMVFDHPYFAVTDDDGKFEIKNAPAGNYRLVYRAESGYHKGREGRYGVEIAIKAAAAGAMDVPTLEFIPPESK